MYARIGARIKKARSELCLSQYDLGAMLGLTATAINYYEKGKRKISIEELHRLAKALAKPVAYFLSDPAAAGDIKQPAAEKAEIINDLQDIPVLGMIKAGEASPARQGLIGFLPLPRQKSAALFFALLVKGDSMAGEGIDEGDLVLINRQNHADFNGQIICALINGEESSLKILLREKDKIILRSANPAYPDIVLENEDALTIQGVYAGVFKFPAALPE
ncbi:LexA family protein [Pelotomaculum propionicicum]|uniref:LexA repressor n=1 Tax=Pelotomaculum propionicicum TaxID=258475 RepID=A0A4Y7RKU7_9FIRM|nr:S24 family peptidase [Pelotomaculum propionicicum]NLI12982.1 helix-turn-helix domain-containing protein [Peptococcaceae bacterium]TEB08937.1 LexA repressor [Pelotomaculum propionicicum]